MLVAASVAGGWTTVGGMVQAHNGVPLLIETSTRSTITGAPHEIHLLGFRSAGGWSSLIAAATSFATSLLPKEDLWPIEPSGSIW